MVPDIKATDVTDGKTLLYDADIFPFPNAGVFAHLAIGVKTLYLQSLAWACLLDTGGTIPAPDTDDPAVGRLVDAGLWEKDGDGAWRIAGWHEEPDGRGGMVAWADALVPAGWEYRPEPDGDGAEPSARG